MARVHFAFLMCLLALSVPATNSQASEVKTSGATITPLADPKPAAIQALSDEESSTALINFRITRRQDKTTVLVSSGTTSLSIGTGHISSAAILKESSVACVSPPCPAPVTNGLSLRIWEVLRPAPGDQSFQADIALSVLVSPLDVKVLKTSVPLSWGANTVPLDDHTITFFISRRPAVVTNQP